MRSESLAREPRSTAYYYGELKHMKTKDAAEVTKEPPKVDIPPLRDRPSPEYSTPEGPKRFPGDNRPWAECSRLPRDNSTYSTPDGPQRFPGDPGLDTSFPRDMVEGRVPGETYSTAGTFPICQKDKEAQLQPLLAELEVVGKVPLEQLGGGARARGWYLCCPDDGEEELTRESSWRYSSLRPVTAAPVSRSTLETASQATPDELSQLRSERDALARALAGSRRAAAAAAGAHDERLAELHGVIAELLRRRAADKTADAIAECESQDECDSTTQPAGELSHEADWSRTDQGDSSPALSPDPDDRELAGTESRSVTSGGDGDTATDKYPEPEVGVNSRRSQLSRRTTSASGTGSCERERGSREDVNAAGRYESRQAKLAFRVRLKRTEDDAREPEELASRAALAARCRRLEEELQDLEHALSVTSDDLHGAWSAQRALGVRARALCAALRSADRALEAYDVLLALAETAPGTQERCAAQRVACELVARLRAPSGREPALPPGPWADHRALPNVEPWSEDMEPALREYCALLKTQSAELRPTDLSELEVAAERVRLEPGTCSKKGSCRRQRSSKERIRHRTGSAPASETDL